MAVIWRKRRRFPEGYSWYMGIALLFLAQFFFLWWAWFHIGKEPARAWQLTLPMVGFVGCLAASVYMIRKSIPRYWEGAARRKVLASLMQAGDDVHVLYDVDVNHRGVYEHYPFLVVGPFGVVVLVIDTHPDTFVYTARNELVRLSLWNKPTTSKLLVKQRNRKESVERLLYDAGFVVNVHSFALCPNKKSMFAEIKQNELIAVESLLTALDRLEEKYDAKDVEHIVKLFRNYAMSQHVS